MKIYVPWKLQVAAYYIYQVFRSMLSQLKSGRHENGLTISFYPDYQQVQTGASVAIACIANQLSSQHNVDAFIKRRSAYSKHLDLTVRHCLSSHSMRGEIIFVDIEQENKVVEALLQARKRIVLTVHAFPTELHAVPQEKLHRNLELATHIHFVSQFQRNEFIGHYSDIDITGKSFVILNYTRQSAKNSRTRNVGIVGYLNRPAKNALKGIQLAENSAAESIQCWGPKEVAGLNDPKDYKKLKLNGWTDSTLEMHESFDVLLTPSHFETFGLVVAEALSAGIPCLLADIPVFQELYAECAGVTFLSGDDSRDIQALDKMLEDAPKLKQQTIEFWQKSFSNDAIKDAWLKRINKIYAQRQLHIRPDDCSVCRQR